MLYLMNGKQLPDSFRIGAANILILWNARALGVVGVEGLAWRR
jgi:hypothetical protein